MDSRVLPSAKKLCGGQPRGTSGVGRTPVRPVPTECPKLIVDILGFLEGHRKVAIIGQEHHPVRPGLPAVRGARRGQRAYVLNWLFKARGSGHAPDSIAAPSGTSANSHDRCRYAFGHVICADVTSSATIQWAVSSSTTPTTFSPAIPRHLRPWNHSTQGGHFVQPFGIT